MKDKLIETLESNKNALYSYGKKAFVIIVSTILLIFASYKLYPQFINRLTGSYYKNQELVRNFIITLLLILVILIVVYTLIDFIIRILKKQYIVAVVEAIVMAITIYITYYACNILY